MKSYLKISGMAIALMLAICVFYPQNVNAETTTIDVSTQEEWNSAKSTISSGAAGEYVMNITEDLEGLSSLTIPANKTVTLVGNGHTIKKSSVEGSFFNVQSGGTFNLGDGSSSITCVGAVYNDAPGMVQTVGTFNMYDGATLKDNQTNNYFGGGVNIYRGGVFNMYGGTIENCNVIGGSVCYGGGVSALVNGTFNMYGGNIKNCKASTTYVHPKNDWITPTGAGGGVFVGHKSTFNMQGGSITNCEASLSGGGVFVQATASSYTEHGELGYLDSYVNISGGTISDCKSGHDGGGVSVFGTFDLASAMAERLGTGSNLSKVGVDITGGSISKNTSSEGAGIFIFAIRPDVNIKNVTIDGNKGEYGAGIEIYDEYTNAKIENCTIKNNVADYEGAGIYVYENIGCETVVKKCTITGNKVLEGVGGGIYYDESSKVIISGANEITGNTAYNEVSSKMMPNNLNILSVDSPIYVGGSLSGSKIGITDPALWGGATESSARLTQDYLANGNSEAPYEAEFISDAEGWYADFSDVDPYTDKEVKLYKAPKYMLVYNDGVTENTEGSYTVDNQIDLPVPERSGYKFLGWYDNEDFSGKSMTKTPAEDVGDITLYAKWKLLSDGDKEDEDEADNQQDKDDKNDDDEKVNEEQNPGEKEDEGNKSSSPLTGDKITIYAAIFVLAMCGLINAQKKKNKKMKHRRRH